MRVDLIKVPYHMGRENVGMGMGPTRLVEAGAVRVLSGLGLEVRLTTVRREGPFTDELDAVTQVNARLARCVAEAAAGGWFPLVLAGNCNSCLGTLSGLSSPDVGIVWFDSHADFNTPDTSSTGFFDGMPLAIATGRCHTELWPRMGSGRPVPETRAILVGARDLDPDERVRLDSSEIDVLYAEEAGRNGLAESLAPRLARLGSLVGHVYLHLDTDALDPEEAPGVDFPSPGGLSSADLTRALPSLARRFRIAAAAVTAYNPERDDSDKTARTLLGLVQALVGGAATWA